MVQAIRALAVLGSEVDAPFLTGLLQQRDLDTALIVEALLALESLPDPDSTSVLLNFVAHPEARVRGLTLQALARLDPLVLLTTLSGLDPDADWTVRAAVAEALGALEPDLSMPRLTVMLDDEDPRVVARVLDALVASDVDDAGLVLERHLTAPDVGVRIAAAQGLAELERIEAAPALETAYDAARAEDQTIARVAILDSLVQLDSSRARLLVDAALTDSAWTLRLRAAELLRDAYGEATVRASAADPAPDWSGPSVDDAPDPVGFLNPPFSPLAYIETGRGTIEVELAILDAPVTVANFMGLAREGFYDGLPVHRVVSDFVVQGGDPHGDGIGGPSYTIRDEINERPYLRGTVGMALSGADTGGSQFFITHSPQPHLDGIYTVFGRVTDGMNVVDGLVQGDIVLAIQIWDGVSPLD